MALNPDAWGPLASRFTSLHALLDLPYGAFVREVRQIDPAWGREADPENPNGELIRYRVTLTRIVEVEESVEVEVEAHSEDEAEELALEINPDRLSWDHEDTVSTGDPEVEDVARLGPAEEHSRA